MLMRIDGCNFSNIYFLEEIISQQCSYDSGSYNLLYCLPKPIKMCRTRDPVWCSVLADTDNTIEFQLLKSSLFKNVCGSASVQSRILCSCFCIGLHFSVIKLWFIIDLPPTKQVNLITVNDFAMLFLTQYKKLRVLK